MKISCLNSPGEISSRSTRRWARGIRTTSGSWSTTFYAGFRWHLTRSWIDWVAVAEKLRPEVVRTVADVWNNGHPAGERPSGFSGPVLVLPGGEDILVTAEVVASRPATGPISSSPLASPLR